MGPYSDQLVSQARPLTIYFTLVLILPSHLLLGLPSSLLPSAFRTKILCEFPGLRVTCLAYLILLDLVNLIIFDE
jgi:hypothetical protein